MEKISRSIEAPAGTPYTPRTDADRHYLFWKKRAGGETQSRRVLKESCVEINGVINFVTLNVEVLK